MVYQDSLGGQLNFDRTPRKVISLVPSITEWLIDMGVEVVGRTKFCIHPEEKVKDVTVVGGTKNFRFDVIDEISPDLIIGNKEENYEQGITVLREKFPVWITEINSFEESLTCFDQLAQCLDVVSLWNEKRNQLNEKFLREKGKYQGSVIYLIWKEPMMAAGKNTYVDSMLTDLGFQNLLIAERYPEIGMEEIIRLNPDYLLLSSEPYPFKQLQVEAFQSILKETQVRLVDGEYYSWYGTRFLKLVGDQVTGEY